MAATISELFADIYQHVKQRVSNPVMSAIGLSWLVWNHRVLWALFSIRPTQDAFTYIDTHLAGSWWWHLIHFYVGPIVSGVAYVYLVPLLTKHAREYSLNVKVQDRVMRKKVEGATLLTYEQSLELKSRYEESQSSLFQSRSEVHKLRDDIASMKLSQSSGELVDQWTSLADDQKQLLYFLSTRYDPMRVADIFGNIPRAKVDVSKDLDALEAAGFITSNGSGLYSGNVEGRKIIPFGYTNAE